MSRLIDNQLRGRAGRQGDRGSSRFIASLDDEIMVRFGLSGSGRAIIMLIEMPMCSVEKCSWMTFVVAREQERTE